MAEEEFKKEVKERKCFGMNERKVLKFVIPCFASFIGCLLALVVYSSLASKSPVPGNCPPPPPAMQRMDKHIPGGHHMKKERGQIGQPPRRGELGQPPRGDIGYGPRGGEDEHGPQGDFRRPPRGEGNDIRPDEGNNKKFQPADGAKRDKVSKKDLPTPKK